MPNMHTRPRGGLIPYCLMNAATWLLHHPLAVELLALATAVGLLPLEVLP